MLTRDTGWDASNDARRQSAREQPELPGQNAPATEVVRNFSRIPVSDWTMPDAAQPIVLENVWKTYGKTTALAGLSLAVPAESVFGFLGPNGAGKSTAIRILLGLQRPSRGTVSLFGRQLPHGRTDVLRRVGSMVESPSPYLHLTGRENLEVHTRLLGLPPRRIDEALDMVNLSPVRDRLVRHYSTGMKQRLGIAAALLGNRDLLVLEEPTNGLDPAGIHEVRGLVRDLPRRRALTIFLSSHLLAEIEQVATHLAIFPVDSSGFRARRRACRRGRRLPLW